MQPGVCETCAYLQFFYQSHPYGMGSAQEEMQDCGAPDDAWPEGWDWNGDDGVDADHQCPAWKPFQWEWCSEHKIWWQGDGCLKCENEQWARMQEDEDASFAHMKAEMIKESIK